MTARIGKLFLVGTPIGNLEDITLRALRILREADLILAEDTRRTLTLLAHHQIHKPLRSCHEFNEAQRIQEVLERLRAGQKIALVTDAGMPTVSDPGLRLVRAVVEEQARCSGASVKRRVCDNPDGSALDTSAATTTPGTILLEIIPGPSAVTAAVAGSGFVTGAWLFYGFLPHKSGQRRKVLEKLALLPYPLVFFESPYRLLKCLADLHEILGNRHAAIGRELTKKFEEFLRGDLDDLLKTLEHRAIKGEITIVVEGNSE